jgi:glutathione S-transferase
MILHYAPGSPHSAAVRIALAEKGIEADERRIDLARFAQHDPCFLALGSGGMVPVLEYDGRAMSESFEVMQFLDETFPATPLAGADAEARCRVLKWGKYVGTHIAPSLAMVRWQALKGKVPDTARAGIERLPAERRELWRQAAEGFGTERLAQAAEALLAAGRRLADDLEGGEWLAGSAITLADIAVYPHVAQFSALGFAVPAPVGAWLSRMAARPAVEAIREDLFPLATMGPEPGRWGERRLGIE